MLVDWLRCDWQSLQAELANQKSAMAVVTDALQNITDRSSCIGTSTVSVSCNMGSGDVCNGVCTGSGSMQKKYSEMKATLADVETAADNKLNSLLQQLRLVCDVLSTVVFIMTT